MCLIYFLHFYLISWLFVCVLQTVRSYHHPQHIRGSYSHMWLPSFLLINEGFVSEPKKKKKKKDVNAHDAFIFMLVLKDKAAQVINLLSQTHWSWSCRITITKFQ